MEYAEFSMAQGIMPREPSPAVTTPTNSLAGSTIEEKIMLFHLFDRENVNSNSSFGDVGAAHASPNYCKHSYRHIIFNCNWIISVSCETNSSNLTLLDFPQPDCNLNSTFGSPLRQNRNSGKFFTNVNCLKVILFILIKN